MMSSQNFFGFGESKLILSVNHLKKQQELA